KAVNDYLTKTGKSPKLRRADFHALRKELLQTAVPFLEEFVRQRPDDPKLEADRGAAYWRLAMVRAEMGETEQALADYGQALAIYERLAADFPKEPMHQLEMVGVHGNRGSLFQRLSNYGAAGEAFRRALAILDQLAADFSDQMRYQE